MALKIINGETDRLLYARTILRAAADAPNRKSALEEEQIESIEFAWSQSQHAYGEILRCQDDGVCRMRSMVSVCEDVTALLAARRTLAAEVDLLSVSEMLSADKGPLNADRLRLLKAEAARDGKISPLEEDVLTLATAVSVAHGIWSLTPEGEKERLRRRKTHAVDEFKQRCDAHAL
ncbi:MAG: hypothetical protein AB7E72_14250 [Lysobacterales bacterium]